MYTLIILCLLSGSALSLPGKVKHNAEKPDSINNGLLPIPVFNIAASKVDFLNQYPSAYTIAEIEPEQPPSQGFRKFFRFANSPISRRPNFFSPPQYAQIATYPTAVSRQSSTIVHDTKNAAISPLAYNQVFAAPELSPFGIVPLQERNSEIYLPIERFISPYSAAYTSEFEFKGSVPFIQAPVPVTSPYAVKQPPCYTNGVIEPVITCA